VAVANFPDAGGGAAVAVGKAMSKVGAHERSCLPQVYQAESSRRVSPRARSGLQMVCRCVF
jgi:hypothetical protein